jgi:ADP-ribose pyrophosphatase YjhB (NUDIX family)
VTLLRTIRDKDFGIDIPDPPAYDERLSARAVVVAANGDVALFHATRKAYHKLPGGRVEEGETVRTALERELLEEIGHLVCNVRELGVIEEFRNMIGLHRTSHCFLAERGEEKNVPELGENEIAEGFETIWVPLDAAITILESEAGIDSYEGKFICLRELTFLKEAKRFLDRA